MGLNQIQVMCNEQKLVLTQSMRQSLKILQMALPELKEYIEDQVISNPLLETEENIVFSPASTECIYSKKEVPVQMRYEDEESDILARCKVSPDLSNYFALENIAETTDSFTDQLHEQLLELRYLDDTLFPICEYLIHCLNERGYLDFGLQELSTVLNVPIFTLEQALYVVQSLEPIGVGARTLEECLILQLAQTNQFNSHTLRLIHEGLPLLAKNDLKGIANLLNCGMDEVHKTCNTIRSLNPIPSRGYGNDSCTEYQIAEATFEVQGDVLTIQLNRSFLPHLHYNQETCSLLQEHGCPEDLNYLRQNSTKAKELIQCIENRKNTIEKLLNVIAQRQKGFFLRNEPLAPMTMGELADELDLNISTVSRALQNKSICFCGKSLMLRQLFSNSISTTLGAQVSSDSIKRQIKRFINAESSSRPLSDEELRVALEAMQTRVSRRTVSKYREELGIPSSLLRRKC